MTFDLLLCSCLFQAADGQHIILHPLNTKCLLHHYGSYDKLPHRFGNNQNIFLLCAEIMEKCVGHRF
jgi:hypothetical protein